MALASPSPRASAQVPRRPSAATLSPSVFTTEESGIINRALALIEEKRLRTKEVLYYFEDFQRYLMLRFAGLTHEQGHVLYLNINRQLLAAETEFIGDQSRVVWDMRKVVLRAIALGAEHVVFAHNHPSDNLEPSEADLLHLDSSIQALRPLRINLLDSYVVTALGITSIKGHQRKLDEARQARLISESKARRAKIAATKARKALAATQPQGVAA